MCKIMNDRTIRKAVVTGPTGAMASALCLLLAQQEVDVYAVCRVGSKRLANIPDHPRIHIIHCDLCDLEKLPDKISGSADVFFHLAWQSNIGNGRNDMPAQIENIHYTITAVQIAKKLGCKVFIGTGSQAEYGRVAGRLTPQTPCFPENGYGMAKLCAGQMSRIEAQNLGIDHIWMRILSVYGPCDVSTTLVSSMIRQLLNGEKPSLTAGEQIWDYLYSEDAARALYLAAKHGSSGKIYPLGCGKAQPLRMYMESIRDEINTSLPLGFGEIPYAPLQVMHLEADISSLYEDTGFVPQVEFTDGVRKTIAWYLAK